MKPVNSVLVMVKNWSCVKLRSQRKAFKPILTTAILAIIFYRFDIDLAAIITSMACPYWLILACCIPFSVIPYLTVNRWRLFLKMSGIDDGFFVLWRINLVSTFQGLVFPSSQGMDVLRIFHIEKRHPDKRGVAGGSVLVERIFGLGILCFLSLVALCFVFESFRKEPIVLLILLGVCCAGILFIVSMTSPHLFALYQEKKTDIIGLSRILGYVKMLHGSLVRFPFRRTLVPSVCYICAFQLSVVCIVYLVFRAYAVDIPFVYHMALFPIISILSMVPITIGGFGVREGFFVYFYQSLDVPPPIAVSVSVMVYVIIIILPAMLGALICLYESMTSISRLHMHPLHKESK